MSRREKILFWSPWLLLGALWCFYVSSPITYLADTANDFVISSRVALGDVIYRDVETLYGPISYLFYGLFFKIFSPSFFLYYLLNFAAIAWALWLLQDLTKRLGGILAASLAGFSFVVFCVFPDDSLNLIRPYSISGLQSIPLLFLWAKSMLDYAEHRSTRSLMIGGACVGYIGCAKAEIAVAAGAVFIVWAFFEVLRNAALDQKERRKRFAMAVLSMAAVAGSVYGFFILKVGFAQFWAANLEVKDYAAGIGRDLISLRYFIQLGVILAFFWLSARILDAWSRKEGWWRAAGAVPFAVMVFLIARYHSLTDLTYFIHASLVVFVTAWLPWNIYKRNGNRTLIYIGALAFLMHLRVWVGQGSQMVYTLPVVIFILAASWGVWVKDMHKALRAGYSAAWSALLIVLCVWSTVTLYTIPSLSWNGFNLEDNSYHQALKAAAEHVRSAALEDDEMFALPNTESYLLSGVRPMGFETMVFSWYYKSRSEAGAQKMLQRQKDTVAAIQERKVRWIVIDTHNHPETGFGKSYGEWFYGWVRDYYRLTASYPVEGGGGVYVYQRRN